MDWPTKLAVVVQKTDASTLAYVMEALCTIMLRKKAADPFSVTDLKRVITEILWIRNYTKAFMRQ